MVKKSSHSLQSLMPCLILLAIFATAGCAPKPRGSEPLAAITAAMAVPNAQNESTLAPLPADISEALIPRPDSSQDSPDFIAESRFDLAADQVDAREFFLGLVKGTRDNMVVHPDVQGKISLSLKNTSVAEVLDVVSRVYGFPYIKTGSVYQVMPLGLQARTFTVDYLNLVRDGTSETRVGSGQITQTVSSEESTTSSNSATQNSNATSSRIETTTKADFWQELNLALRGIVGEEKGRKVVIQPQASAVVVVAMPDEIQAVEAYLRRVQANLQRQVLIEARIIEVTLNDGFQSGINWAILNDKSLVSQTGGGSVFLDGKTSNAGVNVDLGANSSLTSQALSSAFGGVFGLALNLKNFNAFVELLQQQGDVQVLSSPRISTINNQKAVIKVGTDEFFLTDISSDTVSNTSTSSSTDITLTPFFSGIALDVTPQIDAEGGVVLHVHPTVSDVTDQTKNVGLLGSSGSTGQSLSLPLAKSTVRESDSIIRAQSGQIVVIGGLMKENQVQEVAGVPLLGSLPLIGGLFRHTKMVKQKSELVILLRPQVLRNPEQWSEILQQSRQRIQALDPQMQRDWLPSP